MDLKQVAESAVLRHSGVLEILLGTCLPDMEGAFTLIQAACNSGQTIFACGNGGSAASCQHFTAELVGHYKKERGPKAALSLTTDTSALTAIGNDYGFEEVFARQLAGLGQRGDVLVVLSTSGKSRNVIRAAEVARTRGISVVALTGAAGSELAEWADVCITIPSEGTACVQEMTDIILHIFCEALDEYLPAA